MPFAPLQFAEERLRAKVNLAWPTLLVLVFLSPQMRSLHLGWFFFEPPLKLLRELFGKTPLGFCHLLIWSFSCSDHKADKGDTSHKRHPYEPWTTEDTAEDRWEHLATVDSSQLWIFSNSCGLFSHVPRFGDWGRLTPLNTTATHPH